MRCGILSIRFLNVSGVIAAHSASQLLSSSSLDFAIVHEVGSEAGLCSPGALGTQGLRSVCSSPPGPIRGQYGEAGGEELQ